jgi:hypothetical protein
LLLVIDNWLLKALDALRQKMEDAFEAPVRFGSHYTEEAGLAQLGVFRQIEVAGFALRPKFDMEGNLAF